MFLLGEMIVSTIVDHQTKKKEFEAACAVLSPADALKLRDDREARRKRADAHRRAIEVAKAGRSRNFWGNY